MNKTILFVLLATLAGCGLSNNTRLADLTENDAEKLCEKLGAPESFTCDMGDGVTFDFTVGCDPDDIADDTDEYENTIPDSCDATVGDMVDCTDAQRAALADDPCLEEIPAECEALFSESCLASAE